jgi:hypothetical protein
MTAVFNLKGNLKRQAGQTLIIAMIVLGLLLILGFVFLGIVERNIHGTATAQLRSTANDLSEAGIRYAQGQLVDSPLGADWRGNLTTMPSVAGNPNFTLDPDALYLRKGTGLPWQPGNPREDLGGPDGLGPFIRYNAPGALGRVLIRVQYAPSDAAVFSSSPSGPLRNPGQVHSYLQIESIGRTGVVSINDPTTLSTGNPVQFTGFTSTAQLQGAIATLEQYDSQFVNGRHLLAFATPAITNYARYITNKFNVSRAADIGLPNPSTGLAGVGVSYCAGCTTLTDTNYQDIGTQVDYQQGSVGTITSNSTTNPVQPLGGSLMSNADLTLHGNLNFNLNEFFGDKLLIAGRLLGDDNSNLTINLVSLNSPLDTWTSAGPNSWITTTTTIPSTTFSTNSTTFSTENGTILDGLGGTDAAGYARGVGRVTPPSILQLDPTTQETRYLELTRDSGVEVSSSGTSTGVNSGQFGHGSGVYVANTTDVQEPTDEAGRAGADSNESLIYDWLNPANGGATSGWQGPFYVPVGAFVQLLPDGFTIQLDNGTWKDPAGNDSGQNTLRFRVGIYNGQQYIVDGIEPTASAPTSNINGGAATANNGVNFAAGQPFNGVLYFEGNVRVRGIIPTNVQLSVVSGATIYIEGAITKGAQGNDVTDSAPSSPIVAYNTPIATPSKSSLMLMARDYVAVNTTQFTGLLPGQSVNVANDQQGISGYNALRIAESGGDTSGSLNLTTELLTDPTTGTATNPMTWVPYALGYVDANNNPIPSRLLLSQSMDDGTGAASFIQMNVNYGSFTDAQQETVYSFPGTGSTLAGYFTGLDNTASDYLGAPAPAPPNTSATSIQDYGLGRGGWQNYPKYETRGFNLIYPSTTSYNSATGTITSTQAATTDPFIAYTLFAPGGDDFAIRPAFISGVASNDYLLAKAVVVPADFRIEASIFAEEGSFFVIPGVWTSPNPNDTRAAYNNTVGSNPTAATYQAADQQRLETYGNAPEVPFYGEPLDVRVQVIGSVSENMPPPVSAQTASIQKWGWIPKLLGGDNNTIPRSHIPMAYNNSNVSAVPNFVIEYDPMLATGRIDGFSVTNDPSGLVRTDSQGRALLPMPRLPVSPALTYFGEVQ